MRSFTLSQFTLLFVIGGALADEKLKKVKVPGSSRKLAARQVDQYCISGDSCSSCFGEGNVLCSAYTCFNPSAGEQCCATGEYCIGDISCCDISGGPGVTGSDGVPGATSEAYTSTATAYSEYSYTATGTQVDLSQPTSWDCYTGDSDQECCLRGGDEWSWCYGSAPDRICYRPTLGETCCSDGSTCAGGESCCNNNGAIAITPSPSEPASTSTRGSSTADSDSDSSSPTSNRIVGALTASTTDSSVQEASTNLAATAAAQGMAVVAAGFLGLVGLL